MEQNSYIFLTDTGSFHLHCSGFGFERARPGMVWGPAARSYYVIHYVFSGKGVLYNASGAHPISKGQMFVIFPDETAMYVADKEDPWYYCFANFQTTAKPFKEGEYCYTDSRLNPIFHNILLMAQQKLNNSYAVCAELLKPVCHYGGAALPKPAPKAYQAVCGQCAVLHPRFLQSPDPHQ